MDYILKTGTGGRRKKNNNNYQVDVRLQSSTQCTPSEIHTLCARLGVYYYCYDARFRTANSFKREH